MCCKLGGMAATGLGGGGGAPTVGLAARFNVSTNWILLNSSLRGPGLQRAGTMAAYHWVTR